MKRLLLAALVGISINAFADDPPTTNNPNQVGAATPTDASTTQPAPESKSLYDKKAHRDYARPDSTSSNQNSSAPPNPPPINPDQAPPTPPETPQAKY